MNKAEKTQYIADLEKELERNHIYETLERLTRELIVHQPEAPIDFLIDRIKNPEGCIF